MFSHMMGWIWLPLMFFLVFGPWRRSWRRWAWYGGFPRRPERGHESRAPREREQGARQEQIDQLESRVAELESRLDFAERLLAQRREAPMVRDG